MSGRFALIAVLLALPVLASAQASPGEGHGGENVTYGYGQVLRAEPVYEIVLSHMPELRCDGQGAHCRTVQVERRERRLTAYDVEYRYMGETYMSRLPYDPGSRLRLRISVMPDDNRPAGYR